jgi:enoyl-CoA hydratase/carnithine racemase
MRHEPLVIDSIATSRALMVGPADLESKTMELALECEAGPPIAQKLGKMLALKAAGMDFESALEFSGAVLAVLRTSSDRVEGGRAWAEKRPPRFTGY